MKTITEEISEEGSKETHKAVRALGLNESLLATLERYSVDVIVALQDSPIASVATCAGDSSAPVFYIGL